MGEEARIAELETRLAELEASFAKLAEVADGGGERIVDKNLSIPIIGDIGGESYGAFRIEGGTITNRYYQFGRAMKTASEYSGALTDGMYELKVLHSDGSGVIVRNSTESPVANELTMTFIPLFVIENGEIVRDYRGMPVIPVRE